MVEKTKVVWRSSAGANTRRTIGVETGSKDRDPEGGQGDEMRGGDPKPSFELDSKRKRSRRDLAGHD